MVSSAAHMGSASESKTDYAWITIAWGLAAIVLGLFLFVRPGPTAVFLVRVMAIFWLVGGVFDVAGRIMRRGRPGTPWRILGGALSIVGALVVLANPLFGTVLVIGVQFLVIAISALVSGLVSLYEGLRTGPVWGLVALGALQIGVRIFLLAQPLVGILAFVQFLAAVAIIGGVIAIFQTIRQRQAA